MALLDVFPALVEDSCRVSRTPVVAQADGYDGAVFNTAVTRKTWFYRRLYQWACDDLGGEVTHEATYEVDGYALAECGRELPHGVQTGMWSELYTKTVEETV